MDFGIWLEKRSDCFFVEFRGDITAEDVMSIQHLLFEKAEYRDDPRLIMDFTDATVKEGVSAALKVGMKIICQRDFDTRAHVALVLPGEELKELGKVFESVTEEMPYNLEIMSTQVDALDWMSEQ